MKITKSQLKRVIKEELQVVLKEAAVPCERDHNYVKVELFPDKTNDTFGTFNIYACIDGVEKQFTSAMAGKTGALDITKWNYEKGARFLLGKLLAGQGLEPRGGIETVAIDVNKGHESVGRYPPQPSASKSAAGPSYTL